MSLYDHLKTGATTVCRCWAVMRTDGVELGFTDHDRDLAFDGMVFRADTGLSAGALQQGTGLSVDNAEAAGVLSDAAVREDDIVAGRYDGAEVRAWLVNWADASQRVLQFRGSIGEVTRGQGAFQAELRGLTEALNVSSGRVYQSPCTAVLGDAACGVDLGAPGYVTELPAETVSDRKVFGFSGLTDFDDRWFEGGRFTVLSGTGAGLIGLIKNDRLSDGARRVELWQELRAGVQTGDMLRLEAGCDKRGETCKLKFNNLINFQGFPHIPGEDWIAGYPTDGQVLDGGSLFK